MRGGKRAGSGRKAGIPTKTIAVRLSPDELEGLAEIDPSPSAAIHKILSNSGSVHCEGGKRFFGSLINGRIYVDGDARWRIDADGVCRPIWQTDGPSVWVWTPNGHKRREAQALVDADPLLNKA